MSLILAAASITIGKRMYEFILNYTSPNAQVQLGLVTKERLTLAQRFKDRVSLFRVAMVSVAIKTQAIRDRKFPGPKL